MDYVQLLREETAGAHAQFHQFLLALSSEKSSDQYFFFEGDDDPVFYMAHIPLFIGTADHHEFICGGREAVLKVQELAAQDGRATDRTHFFVDKDHNDIIPDSRFIGQNTFQTFFYSFENYLVDPGVFRRFWVERLYLPSTDPRLPLYIEKFNALHRSFMKRMRILMSIILIGRGVDGREPIKLNLNNVCLDKVISFDLGKDRINWVPNALSYLLASSSMAEAGVFSVSSIDIRRTYRRHLKKRESKEYVRGKYELWFFVKLLCLISCDLSNRKKARDLGQVRAKPKDSINITNGVAQLSPLVTCPQDLKKFLAKRFGIPEAFKELLGVVA